jgi:hypothetical protein
MEVLKFKGKGAGWFRTVCPRARKMKDAADAWRREGDMV